MRDQATQPLVKISKTHLRELTTEVKETIATDFCRAIEVKTNDVFTSAQLWFIHKNMRTAASRRK